MTDGVIDEYTASGWDSASSSFDIMGRKRQGGYAEFAKAHHTDVLPVSDKLSFEEWAAIPLVTLTAWHMLVTRAQLKPGETVLVHAAGSGIGTMAIQLAKVCGASQVFTTVGSDEKAEKAKALGADVVINYRKQDFAEEVLKLTGKRGVDVIFEHIGPGDVAEESSLPCPAGAHGHVRRDERPASDGGHPVRLFAPAIGHRLLHGRSPGIDRSAAPRRSRQAAPHR